jgi:hypothetical protein
VGCSVCRGRRDRAGAPARDRRSSRDPGAVARRRGAGRACP